MGSEPVRTVAFLIAASPDAAFYSQIAALNAELGFGGGNIQHRDAQIAVVLERDLYEALQAWIGEEVPPANLIE